MKRITLALIMITILGLAPQTEATIVELAIDAAGEYTFDEPYSTFNFDLGVTFSDISNVSINWSGSLTGALIQKDSGGDPGPIDVGVKASFNFNPSYRMVTTWGGGATYPTPEDFDVISEIELGMTSTWSDLLDGQGTVHISLNEYSLLTSHYVEHGTVLLDSAVIMVEGTVVPEPTSVALLGIGTLFFFRQRRKR